ncbi:MAG: hypothetical protein AAGA57_07145 [Planctomycetota bacterium]
MDAAPRQPPTQASAGPPRQDHRANGAVNGTSAGPNGAGRDGFWSENGQAPSQPAEPPKTSWLSARRGGLRRLVQNVLPATVPRQPPSAAAARTQLGVTTTVKDRERLVAGLRQVVAQEAYGRLLSRSSEPTPGRLVDVLIAGSGEPKLLDETFPRLRWGGLFAYVGVSERSVRQLAESYDDPLRGYVIEMPPTPIRMSSHSGRLGRAPIDGYCFTARKVRHVQAGGFTERFTYDVELTPQPDAPNGYIVTKRVPSHEDLFRRLRQKFPGTDPDALRERARKLVDHIFPTFLTREAGILQILAKHLPFEVADRVPACLTTQRDHRGMVQELQMNWLRNGGQPLSHLEFAKQAAQLLTVIHEHARVMHLDLRLDNFVITEQGVGFVDFGSAVRIGEDFGDTPVLKTLFSEMMRTSQLQRMLGKMVERGDVTNETIAEVHGKVDKTVDAFYLAVQIAKPYGNPELTQLIEYDPNSEMARRLSALTAAILRPKTANVGEFKTAGDILRGVLRIEGILRDKGLVP